ncbi:SPFH domain-containing protein [Sphaerisporangium corydalis]|uniref:SPFH domain-containing protein n=1 Tax=Sphaerisporangium corydalis TaxID=1441875 RepID=A0ABV9EM32_9ACTN|nr:SPFH domain-containing protein [Sphaerisporangium corydalis]
MTQLVVAMIVVAIAGFALYRTIRIVPHAQAFIIERLGRYHRTLTPGLTIVVPFIDTVKGIIDLREQVVSFPPQPVITSDNLVVSIDTVIYFQVTDPKAATYEIANYLTGVEQLTGTTLRAVVGGLDLDRTMASREEINAELRAVLDDATGKWGIRVNRVELKSIDPPSSIQDSVERQMRADRDKRAAILSAEGQKQSAILTAEGEGQAAILKARGDAEAAVLRAQADADAQALRARSQADALATVFRAIHAGDPDQRALAYRYLQALPETAKGGDDTMRSVPSETEQDLGEPFTPPDEAPLKEAPPGETSLKETPPTQ